MAEPGRGCLLYPTKHRVSVTPATGQHTGRWGWRLLAPAPDQTVLMVGTQTYGTAVDAMRQAKIVFKRHRVDLLLLSKGRAAGTEGGDAQGGDVPSHFNR